MDKKDDLIEDLKKVNHEQQEVIGKFVNEQIEVYRENAQLKRRVDRLIDLICKTIKPSDN